MERLNHCMREGRLRPLEMGKARVMYTVWERMAQVEKVRVSRMN